MFLKKTNKFIIFFVVIIPLFLFFFNSISLAAQIKIIHPKKGDTLLSGKSTKICWDGNDSYPVDLVYSTNKGKNWEKIIENYYGQCYEWTPPVSDFEDLIFKITLTEYHPPRMTKIIKPAHFGEINSVRFSNDFRYFLSCGADSKVFLWDNESGTAIDSMVFPKLNRVFSAEYFHNPDTILIAYDSTAIIWIRENDEIISLPKFGNVVRSIAVHPFENIFAVSSYAGNLMVFSLTDKIEVIHELYSRDTSGIYTVRFSPDGQFFHFSDYYGNTVLFNYPFAKVDEPIILISNQNRIGNVIWSASVSYDSKFIAAGGVDDSVRVWYIPKKELINTYDKHTFHIRSVNFHPLVNVCMSGGLDGFIRQWDIFSLENFCEPIDNSGMLISSDYSFDGKYVISAGRDGSIKIWRNCYTEIYYDTINTILKNQISAKIPHIISSPNKKIIIPIIIENQTGYYSDKKILSRIKVEIPNKLLEINNQEFQLTRHLTRKDTVDFLAELNLKGTLDTIKVTVLRGDRNYEEIRLLDFSPLDTLNLLIEKVDGSIRIEENCISEYNMDVVFSLAPLDLKIYPNPTTNGEIDVLMNLIEDGMHKLEIITSDGQQLKQFESYYNNGSYKFSLDLSRYVTGSYLLRLISPNGEVSRKFIIIE